MLDIFDKFLEKITSGDTAKRTRRVAIQAVLLVAVCVLAFVLLALSTIDLKINAKGEVVGFDGERCPIIKLMIEGKHVGKVSEGQQVIIKNGVTSQSHVNFFIKEVEKSRMEDRGYFSATSICHEPLQSSDDLKLNTPVKAFIVFEKKIVGKILLKKEM